MSDRKLRWGIVGTGAIARKFAAGLQSSEHGRLVAVASRSAVSGAAFAESWGAGRVHVGVDALGADPFVDAVYIATPHPEHAWAAVRLAEAGKHLLVEKPLALNRADADAIAFAAERGGVQLMEGFMYRCHPQTALLVNWIREGRIGELRCIRATFSFRAGGDPNSRLLANALGGGGILDVGGYPVSLARLLAGAASGKDFAEPLKVKGCAFLGGTGVDEYASAILEFPGGIIAEVSCGTRLQRERTAVIYGSEGHIVVPNPFVPPNSGDTWSVQLHHGGQVVVHSESAAAQLYAMEADWFADQLCGRPTHCPGMTVLDSLGNMDVLDRWRSEIGLVYDEETFAANRPTIDRRPLAVRAPAAHCPTLQAALPGSGLLRSRLVMGVDNQTSYPKGQVIFDEYFRLGGSLFDTSYIYAGGRCEEVLGAWIANRGVRSKVSIIAKGAHTPTCYPELIGPQLQQSLNRLRCDQVELYLMHRDNPQVPVGEFVDALNAEWRAGRILAFGGSNWSHQRLAEANAYAAAHGLQPMRAVSNNFSLARMVDPVWAGCLAASSADFVEFLQQTCLPLFAWSSQARGFFTERAGPQLREDRELVRCWYADDNFERRRRACELAATKGVLPIQIALAYVLCQSFPTFPLIGPRNLAELHSSWSAQAIHLSADECRWLNLQTE